MKAQTLNPRRFLRASARLAAVLMLLPTAAPATGFFINQQSVKGLGRVDAGNTAAADSLGTIFFNPAGVTEMWTDPGATFMWSFGAHYVIPRTKLRDTGSTAATAATGGAFVPTGGGDARNPVDPTPVPNLYAAFRFDDAVTVGLGVNAPFGLKTEFHPGWFGRYDAIEASLRTINVSLVAGYKIDSRLSIGGGIDLQYARATLSSAIPNPLALGGPTAATDARVGTVGHDWSPGFNVGVLYKLDPNGRTRVGAHYRSGMKHELEGSTAITGFTGVLAGFNGLFDVRSDLRLPAIATVGVRHELPNGVVLLGEIEWFDWSKFKEVRTRFNNGSPDAVRQTNYRDAWAFAVGAEYKVPRTDWTARGGVQLDKTPTTDAWRDTTVPDADRLWLGVGATYRFSKKVSLDMAFNHVFLRDTSIAVRRTFDGGTTAVTSGAATNVVNTIAADLRVSY